jgi:hypothetical protein
VEWVADLTNAVGPEPGCTGIDRTWVGRPEQQSTVGKQWRQANPGLVATLQGLRGLGGDG